MLRTIALPAILLLLMPASSAQSTAGTPQVSARGRAIHQSALVIDTHADTPQRFLDEKDFDIGQDTPVSKGHFDLGKARAGNLAAAFFSIWCGPEYKGQYAHRAHQLIDAVYRQAEKNPRGMMMAYSTADILAARKQRKLAALMGMEGGHMIENDLALLRDFYRLGIRYMTLTWANTNEWADSSGDINNDKVQHHNGLTAFGREVVREMNRLGMLVDVSHVSDKTFFDTIETTRAPVIASHSSARALTAHARNMTDKMLKAIARNGGVVMVNFFPAFIDDDFRKVYAAGQKERREAEAAFLADYKAKHNVSIVPYAAQAPFEKEQAAKYPRPPLKSLIDHIDHIARTAGVDHVGLGSDFDGVSALPQGIDSVADLPVITQALLDRGYTKEQIHKVLGGNFMRVFREAERISRGMKANASAAAKKSATASKE